MAFLEVNKRLQAYVNNFCISSLNGHKSDIEEKLVMVLGTAPLLKLAER